MSKFIDWFEGRIKPLKMTGYVYDASKHIGWGNSIEWLNYEKRVVVGWLQRKPKVGDEIVFEMASGKRARYGVTSVEHCGDPRDMFFADVMDIGYEDEEPINRVKEATNREYEPKAVGSYSNMTMSELENMIDMLEQDLEWMRKQANPHNATPHKYARMFLTLAREIQKLKTSESNN